MALYPEGDKLDQFHSRYVLSNLAARRAKQIKEGAPVLVETSSTHPLTIALEEIADGAVKPIIVQGEIVPQAADTLESIDLLAREGAGLEDRLEEFGLLGVGEDGGPSEALGELASLDDALVDEPTTEFDEEIISLDDLLTQEESAAKGEVEDDLGDGADLPEDAEEADEGEVEVEDEALTD